MYLIGNGRLLTRNPKQPFIEDGGVVTDGGTIVETDETKTLKLKYPQAEFIDAERCVIMPGIINACTRMCDALIRAFPVPEHEIPEFNSILKNIYRKLNGSMTLKASRLAAAAAAAACIRNGVTAILDGRPPFGQLTGSLFVTASAVREAGIRACLCCETSDEYGRENCENAVTENVEFIEYVESLNSNRLKAAFGLDSPSELSNTALKKCIARNRGGMGYYVHLSGDYGELYESLRKFGARPVERLHNEGILGNKTILAGCVHVNENEADVLHDTGTAVIINPTAEIFRGFDRTNIKLLYEKNVVTGMGGSLITDMSDTLKAAVILCRKEFYSANKAESAACNALFKANPAIASQIFNVRLGILAPGAAADIIVTDYLPYTPFSAENADKHILYGMSGKNCKTTMIDGRILMHNRKIMFADEETLNREIVDFIKSLWKQLN